MSRPPESPVYQHTTSGPTTALDIKSFDSFRSACPVKESIATVAVATMVDVIISVLLFILGSLS
jgi:hypothetical protein